MGTIRQYLLRFIGGCLALAVAGCMGSDGGSEAGAISEGVTLAAITANGQPTQLAHLTVPLRQNLDGQVWINVAVDLNGDGVWADYPLADGSVQPEWVVQNMPVFVKAGQSQNFYIDFNDAGALARSKLPLRAIITSAPVDSLPATGWDAAMATLATRAIQINAIGVEARIYTPNPFGTVGGGQTVLREDVPDRKQPENTNECVPTATANSLRWLAARDPAGFKDLPSDDDTIKELKTDLSFSEDKKGVDPKDILAGKQKFIDRHKLPIDSHQIGAVDDPLVFDKIMAELQKGQDVEIVIKWTTVNGQNQDETNRHMVTVVGATVRADGGMRLHVQDPKETPGVDNLKVDVHPDLANKPQWITNWPPFGGFIEYAFADSPRSSSTVATPSTPGTTTSTTTSTTPAPSTPGTTTSTTPPPPPPAALKLNGNTSFSLTHVQGQTACPTPIGSVALQNTGGSTMSVSVGGGAAWLDLSGASAMVPAGGSFPLSFQFNCSNYSVGSQSTTLSIQASDSASGASAGQATLSISLTVQ